MTRREQGWRADFSRPDRHVRITPSLPHPRRFGPLHRSPQTTGKWTDNSPAWFFHYVLYNDLLIEPASFAALIAATPSHVHDVNKLLPASINSAGWYVAHIYRVNNGDTKFTEWGEAELIRRFMRNVHPCNHFYVPKGEGTRLGEAEHVIAQFAHWNAQRYAAVWPEFLALAQAAPSRYDEHTGSIDCSFGPQAATATPPPYVPPAATTQHEGSATPAPKVTYKYYRFGFKAEEIEPLQAGDAFRMVTPVGIFQMTKAQFYATFPGVITSKSYRVRGEYHWPKLPAIALQFRINM